MHAMQCTGSVPSIRPLGAPDKGSLGEDGWAAVAPILPGHGESGALLAQRLHLEGMLHVLRHDWAWRLLPAHFGKWQSVYQRSRRWAASGVWDRLLVALVETGLTDTWLPASSRYGAELFDGTGVPKRGFFHIVLLRQAAIYRAARAAGVRIAPAAPVRTVYQFVFEAADQE